MKICILSPRYPWPETGGDTIRMNRLASYLKSQNHEVFLVCFFDGKEADNKKKLPYDKTILVRRYSFISAFNSFLYIIQGRPIQCGYYQSPLFYRKFSAFIESEKPDRYICWLPRMSDYIIKAGLCDKTILEMSDALSKTYSLSTNSKSRGLKKIIYKIERRLIYNEEQKLIKLYPKVVLVAQPDIDYLKSEAKQNVSSLKFHTIGVDLLTNLIQNYDSNKICFVGNMRTLQNQDAVFRFVNYIFPIIVENIPNAQFYIVGAEPPQNIKRLENNNIHVTGFVDNLHNFISDSCLAVAPVEIAAGIQNKVLVAMGCGIPVVMSSLISKAIPELINGENCFICDNPKDFAFNCINIMQSHIVRKKLSHNGYAMVDKNYSWKERLKGYEII